MFAVRLVKAAMVACAALFALLVSYNNVVDYGSNYEFVRHTLSMDTTLPDSTLRSRAITSPTLWAAAYWLIIASEALAGILLAFGAARLFVSLRADASTFNSAKNFAVLGAGVGFLLYFFGFMVVAGEWFVMWQSKTWNGQQGAFRFYVTLLLILIFLNQRDGELDK
jgi:predicted small integral membrane protein